MKILRISSLPTNTKPGMGLAALRLAEAMDKETLIVSYETYGDDLSVEALSTDPVLIPFKNPTMPQKRFGAKFLVSQVKRLVAILRFAFGAVIVAQSYRPDVVHIHSPMHFIVAYWAKRKGVPVFLTFHGTDFTRVVQSKVYQLCLRHIGHINCVSSHQVVPLKEKFPKSLVTLVSNGADLDLFLSARSCERPHGTIVAVGTLRWHKGFGELIDTFSEFESVLPGWKLRIIGDGAEREALEDKIAHLGLQRRVSLLGSLSRNEVANELKNSDVFVLSSITEGLPKVLLEAMASGCCCVAFKVGDAERVLDGAGVLVEPGDYSGLKRAILSVAKTPDKRIALGNIAANRASEFSWSKYCKLHREMYLNALKNKRVIK